MKLSELIGKKTDPMMFVGRLLLLAIVISSILFFYRGGMIEGYSQLGASLSDSMGDGVRSSWLNPDKHDKERTNNMYSHMESNVVRQSPLPQSEMLIFNNNKFSPECCPSTYSSSTGCLCATPEQIKYLNAHGGNRTVGGAPSEY